jgi:hypothetical protein
MHTALYRDVEAAEKQCKELEKVVALIENNRQRFRHIDNVRRWTTQVMSPCMHACVHACVLLGKTNPSQVISLSLNLDL